MRGLSEKVKDYLSEFLNQNILYLSKNQFIALVVLLIFLMSGVLFSYFRENQNPTVEEVLHGTETVETTKTAVGKIKVHICGEVVNPGVYEFDEGLRVVDALETAGGSKKEADLSLINLAEKLFDGEKIYFPKYGEVSILKKGIEDGLVDLNRASIEDLKSLKGIGDVIAERIITYRENQQFTKKEDLLKVDGVGDKKFKQIEEKIIVR